ncbi:MAG: glutamate racemase [Limnochordia bacterium]|jgi:glutamate racemase|nr:glutamate racemase [Limnochordia bacterium]MDD4517737.1 glutamate racemase [Limnochordia bacterium]
MANRIGVYDSGLGGLTVVSKLREYLPDCSITYFADTARLPYGDKTPEEINVYAWQIISFLQSQQADLIVVACNTSSALALDNMRRIFQIPLVGVISFGVRAAVRVSKSGKIGLIATTATVNSKAYEREAADQSDSVIYSQPCPLLVPLVEAGRTGTKESLDALKAYVTPLVSQRIDTLILGCTHYPFLVPELESFLPKGIQIIDPAEETALEVQRQIGDCPGPRVDYYFCSGNPEEFRNRAKGLGYELEVVKAVDMDQLYPRSSFEG